MRRLALLALVAAAAALAPAAAATTRPDVGRLWHDFPLGHTRLAHSPRPKARTPPSAPVRSMPRRGGTFSTALAVSAIALTVIGLIGVAHGRAGTATRVLAFYAVAAAIGVIVGLLITPLVLIGVRPRTKVQRGRNSRRSGLTPIRGCAARASPSLRSLG